MTQAITQLPIREFIEPESEEELAETVRRCAATGTAIYPVGGGTSLRFGLPPRREGIGLSLARLDRIIDYPARDMTITVQAGTTMQKLAEVLSGEHQRLPIDVPAADRATVGGVVVTNSNGPRRFGQGSVRDHLIGVRAIDGRGTHFHGGGRVVKNVAGYDFCKLLTGSLGTLGVVTLVTLKLKPAPASLAFLACESESWAEAEVLLAALSNSMTTPVTIAVLSGPAWSSDPVVGPPAYRDVPRLAVALEGTTLEVEWMIEQLSRELRALGVDAPRVIDGAEAFELMDRLAEFPGQAAQLVLEGSVVPSHTTRLAVAAQDVDASCSILAYAGTGKLIMQFAEFPAAGLSRTLVAKLQPTAIAGHGNIVILVNETGSELTPQSVWGGTDTAFWLMERVKRQFDPANLLNPGRFVYRR